MSTSIIYVPVLKRTSTSGVRLLKPFGRVSNMNGSLPNIASLADSRDTFYTLFANLSLLAGTHLEKHSKYTKEDDLSSGYN